MNQDNLDIDAMMTAIGARARAVTPVLAAASGERKHAALIGAADEIWRARDEIIAQNARDLDYGRDKGLGPAMMDRLALDQGRMRAMVDGLRAVADQRDPVGEVIAEWNQPSGLNIRRVRTPIGVIGVIFESRPNVTADAAALCLKSGNAVILRAGSEALHSAIAIHAAIVRGLKSANLPAEAVQLVPTRDREAVKKLITMVDFVDVIVPRGGKGLVGLIQAEARVPVFAHLEGIVHIYVDRSADDDKARRVVLNAKTRRTGICGAAECLLIHRATVPGLGTNLIKDLIAAGVSVHGDAEVQAMDGAVIPAGDKDWGREYLSSDIAAKVVDDIDEAIAHIRQYSSNHTDAIITESDTQAERFFNALDSAILMHNASTQFADGGEFGMGAEIGIATGKLHARGPVGATQLTSFKYLVRGDGTVRG